MRYVVTGGAGFIGSHLTDALLAAGHNVRVLDDLSTGKRQNLATAVELVVGDVSDAAAVVEAMCGMDACFHLAAIASVQRGTEDWCGTHRVNLSGTIAVLDAARVHGRLPVVYASSAAVYGDPAGATCAEDAHCAPLTAYGADKYGCELHAAVGWHVHRVPAFGLRFFNVYGRRQDPSSPYSGVISIFAARLAAGLPVTLHGDGGQTRDFVHVSDVVAHLIAAMRVLGERPDAYVRNVCTGRETSVAARTGVLAEVLGMVPAVGHGPARVGDIRRSVGDAGRAVVTLGVRANVLLRDGLADLVGSGRSA